MLDGINRKSANLMVRKNKNLGRVLRWYLAAKQRQVLFGVPTLKSNTAC